KASADQNAARAKEQQLRDDLKAAEKQLREAREKFLEEKSEAEQARREVERLQRECGQVYADLPEAQRVRVSPAPPASWLDTAYPSVAELTQLRQQAGGLDGARRTLREAEDALQKWGEHKGRESTIRDNLRRMQAELPA